VDHNGQTRRKPTPGHFGYYLERKNSKGVNDHHENESIPPSNISFSFLSQFLLTQPNFKPRVERKAQGQENILRKIGTE
jgi:hypothetical protein